MARPEDDYIPASDEPVIEPEIDSFELLWEKHRTAIIAGGIALVVLIAGFIGWITVTTTTRNASQADFAAASTPDAYRAIIEKYPRTVVAGNSALLLAKALRDEDKLDEANQVLADFVKALPDHPFAPLASVAIAENEALAGKMSEAIQSLQLVADTHTKSFVAPVALMLKADLALSTGDRNTSLQTHQALSRLFNTSVASDSSAATFDALQALARPASKSRPAAPAESPEPQG